MTDQLRRAPADAIGGPLRTAAGVQSEVASPGIPFDRLRAPGQRSFHYPNG